MSIWVLGFMEGFAKRNANIGDLLGEKQSVQQVGARRQTTERTALI